MTATDWNHPDILGLVVELTPTLSLTFSKDGTMRVSGAVGLEPLAPLTIPSGKVEALRLGVSFLEAAQAPNAPPFEPPTPWTPDADR